MSRVGYITGPPSQAGKHSIPQRISDCRNPVHRQGFTLVEVMIAMTIGLILLAAVAQVFATSRATYQFTDGLSRVQENGRFGMHFLTWDARMAGYMSCLRNSTPLTNHLNNPTDYATDFVLGQFINGHAYSGSGTGITDWNPALPANYFTDGEVVPNSDVLVIRRGSDATHKVLPPHMPTPSAALHLDLGNGLFVNDIVIVSDCKSADMFQITGPTDPDATGTLNHNIGAVSQGPGNATQDLSKTYADDAEILKLETHVYYIGRQNNDPSNPPALFRKRLHQGVLVSEELVDSVESMQVSYGEDTDNDTAVDSYGKADMVTDWSRVATLRVGLLVRTPHNVDTELDRATYVFDGATLGPFNDHRQRRVFTSTVSLRN